MKRIKRKEDDVDADQFYVPSGYWMAANSAMACTLDVQQPAAPQKPDRPDTLPSPILSVSPEDLSRETIGQMKRNYVSRRLLFDDEEKISVNKHISQQLFNNSEPTDVLEEKTNLEDDPYQTIINSLSARGFVINNHSLYHNDDGLPERAGLCISVGTNLQMTDMRSESCGILTSLSPPPICGQFECLSVFEGIVYSVHVTANSTEGDKSVKTAKVLATVGPHPHIVSYFCNWMDARYHYMQMEQCQTSLSSLRMNNVADCRMVLEHISCALHYLHDGKMYAHNRVSRPNVYSVLDGDCVVFKLGGFDAATKLSADSNATAADVQSLCLMVLGLIKDGDGWPADEDDLQLYLSSMTGTVNPAVANALSVWRWCCDARHRLPLLRTSLSDMVYRSVGTGIDDEGSAAVQTAATSSFKRIDTFPKLPWSPRRRASDNE